MKTTIPNNIEAATDYINGLSDSELIQLHNEYCYYNNYSDDEIFRNDVEFLNTFFKTPADVARAIHFGNWSYSNKWVKFNGYGNLESFNNPETSIDIETLAQAILDDPDAYGIEFEEED